MFSGKTTSLVWTYSELAVCGRRPLVVTHKQDTRYGETGVVTHGGVAVPCVRVRRLADVSCLFRPKPQSTSSVLNASFNAGNPTCEVVTATLTAGPAPLRGMRFSVFATRHVLGDSEEFTAFTLRGVLSDLSHWTGVSVDSLRRTFLDSANEAHGTAPKECDAVLIDEAQFFPDLVGTVRKWSVQSSVDVWVHGLDGDYLGRRFGEVLEVMPWCESVEKLTGTCGMCGVAKSTMTLRLSGEDTVENEALVGTDQYAPACARCHAAANAGESA
jgi:thymidine kinase